MCVCGGGGGGGQLYLLAYNLTNFSNSNLHCSHANCTEASLGVDLLGFFQLPNPMTVHLRPPSPLLAIAVVTLYSAHSVTTLQHFMSCHVQTINLAEHECIKETSCQISCWHLN